MDGRNEARRPRTRQGQNELNQPVSWQGKDPIELRNVEPQRTFEVPLRTFPAEINIPINTFQNVQLPQNCAQIAFINVVAGVVVSINGGGQRTIKDGFIYNGEFSTLEVLTDATGTVTIQLAAW